MHLVEEGEVVALESGVGGVADRTEVLDVGRRVPRAGNPDHSQLRTLLLDLHSLAAAIFGPNSLLEREPISNNMLELGSIIALPILAFSHDGIVGWFCTSVTL